MYLLMLALLLSASTSYAAGKLTFYLSIKQEHNARVKHMALNQERHLDTLMHRHLKADEAEVLRRAGLRAYLEPHHNPLVVIAVNEAIDVQYGTPTRGPNIEYGSRHEVLKVPISAQGRFVFLHSNRYHAKLHEDTVVESMELQLTDINDGDPSVLMTYPSDQTRAIIAAQPNEVLRFEETVEKPLRVANALLADRRLRSIIAPILQNTPAHHQIQLRLRIEGRSTRTMETMVIEETLATHNELRLMLRDPNPLTRGIKKAISQLGSCLHAFQLER